MHVRFLLASAAFFATTAANAADPSAGSATSVTTASEPQTQQRRPDRTKPAPTPQQRRRTIEAPNAALMMIPASYTPRG